MPAVAERGLIVGAGVLRETVRPGLVPLNAPVARLVHVEPHPDDPSGDARIEACSTHQARDLVVRVVRLPAAVRPILRIGVDPDVVALLETKGPAVVRVDVGIRLVHPGLPLVSTVDVGEWPEQHG